MYNITRKCHCLCLVCLFSVPNPQGASRSRRLLSARKVAPPSVRTRRATRRRSVPPLSGWSRWCRAPRGRCIKEDRRRPVLEATPPTVTTRRQRVCVHAARVGHDGVALRVAVVSRRPSAASPRGNTADRHDPTSAAHGLGGRCRRCRRVGHSPRGTPPTGTARRRRRTRSRRSVSPLSGWSRWCSFGCCQWAGAPAPQTTAPRWKLYQGDRPPTVGPAR